MQCQVIGNPPPQVYWITGNEPERQVGLSLLMFTFFSLEKFSKICNKSLHNSIHLVIVIWQIQELTTRAQETSNVVSTEWEGIGQVSSTYVIDCVRPEDQGLKYCVSVSKNIVVQSTATVLLVNSECIRARYFAPFVRINRSIKHYQNNNSYIILLFTSNQSNRMQQRKPTHHYLIFYQETRSSTKHSDSSV